MLHSRRYTPRLSRNKTIDYAFSNGRALQNNSSLLIFTHTIQTQRLRNRITNTNTNKFIIRNKAHTCMRAGTNVIIPKPHFSSREGINSPCRRFDLLFPPCWFNLSLLTTLTARVLVRHGRAITSESGVTPLFIE